MGAVGFFVTPGDGAGYSARGRRSAPSRQSGESQTVLSAAHRVITAGQSPALRDLFRSLAEIEGAGGPKFSRKALHVLAQAVACRSYERMALETVHLVRAAALTAGRHGFEGVFWGMDQATASAFRGHFAGRAEIPGRLAAIDGGVELRYPDGRFAVRFGRMPILSAFLEFTVAAIGFAALTDILAGIDAPDGTVAAQSKAANALSRALYEFLGDHLPTVQAQRKFRSLIAFLERDLGRDFRPEAIDDETVLDFWRDASSPGREGSGEGGDFRAYRTVVLAFLRLVELLEDGDALARFERMHAIGPDREAGEVDPGEDSYLNGAEWAPENPLSAFAEAPLDAVKFLNKRETEALTLPAEEGARLLRLPLSYLRAETFGAGQHRLIQALRRKADLAEIRTIAEDAAPQTYTDRIALLNRIDEHLQKLALASLPVLGGGGDETALRARKAFEALSRQGFEAHRLNDPDIQAAFQEAAAPLAELRERVRTLLNRLEAGPDWAQAYRDDQAAFAEQFLLLYGEAA